MVSKVHHCTGQINVAEERNEPPAPRCRCRKFVSIDVATAMVDAGEASWVVIKRTRGNADMACEMCIGDKSVTNCAGCKGKGLVNMPVIWDEYNNDIVLVSQLPGDKTEKKRSSVLKKKTPRVATVERAHIERAYVYLKKEAEERIELYGESIVWSLQELGAEVINGHTGEVIMPGKVEPKGDAKKGTGRDYDWGRCI
jgi:hypothetical protein